MLPWSRLDCNWFPWSLTLGRATTCYQMPMATVIVPAPSQMSILLNQSLGVNHLDLTLWSLQFLNVICINHWGRKKKSYWQPFLKCQQQANAICWYFPTFCPFHMSKVHIKTLTVTVYICSLFCLDSSQAAWSCQLEKMELKLEKCCPKIGRRQDSSRLQPLQKFATCNHYKRLVNL